MRIKSSPTPMGPQGLGPRGQDHGVKDHGVKSCIQALSVNQFDMT